MRKFFKPIQPAELLAVASRTRVPVAELTDEEAGAYAAELALVFLAQYQRLVDDARRATDETLELAMIQRADEEVEMAGEGEA